MNPLIAHWITTCLDPAIEACVNQPALMPALVANRKNQLAALKHLKWVLNQEKFWHPYFADYLEYRHNNGKRYQTALLVSEINDMLENAREDVETQACDYTWSCNTASIFNDIGHLMRANVTLVSQFGSEIAAETRDME